MAVPSAFAQTLHVHLPCCLACLQALSSSAVEGVSEQVVWEQSLPAAPATMATTSTGPQASMPPLPNPTHLSPLLAT